jgi:hypothetical protein
MFSRTKSPVKKKFAKATVAKKPRRSMDPRTVVLIKQGFVGLGLVCFLALLYTAIWYGTRVNFLTIETVTVTGGETIDHDAVRRLANDLLTGEYIGLIPRRFVWFYPETDITAAIAALPRVKDPQVTVVSGRELAITFDEYIPYALWCMDKASDDCYFIDETGFAFTRAPQLSGGAFPRFHTIGTAPAERTTMVPVADLRAIELVRARVSQDLALPIASVETDIMRDIFLSVAGGGEIKATLRMTPEETIENLRTILSSEEFKDITPGSFQYIDLRFGNKIFVNEEEPGLATTTVSTNSELVPEDLTPVPDTLDTITEEDVSNPSTADTIVGTTTSQ